MQARRYLGNGPPNTPGRLPSTFGALVTASRQSRRKERLVSQTLVRIGCRRPWLQAGVCRAGRCPGPVTSKGRPQGGDPPSLQRRSVGVHRHS